MIVVREIFYVKYGRIREAVELFQEGVKAFKAIGFGSLGVRVLTEIAGERYYTTVLETMYESLAAWEQASQALRGSPEWAAWYQKIAPLVESGERKIYSVVG